MRATSRPRWPTHRWKRHRLRYARPEWMTDHAEPIPDTPQEMARDLVSRGLASTAILGPISKPRPRDPHEREQER